MRIVKKRIVVFLLLLIILFSVLNFWGVSIKLSKDYHYAVIVLPYDLSIDPLRLVNITVISLTGEKTSWDLPQQRREHFRACYWGNNDKFFIDYIGVQGSISHEEIPMAIIRRL